MSKAEYVSAMKGEVDLCVLKAVRISESFVGEKQVSINSRCSGVIENGVVGRPVLNSSMVESTISYFSSRVAESGN